MQVADEVKQMIIDMADIRFRRYGFGKTTMAEIAKDCCMSAANLYRYFKNKQEIGVSIALKCMREKRKSGPSGYRTECGRPTGNLFFRNSPVYSRLMRKFATPV